MWKLWPFLYIESCDGFGEWSVVMWLKCGQLDMEHSSVLFILRHLITCFYLLGPSLGNNRYFNFFFKYSVDHSYQCWDSMSVFQNHTSKIILTRVPSLLDLTVFLAPLRQCSWSLKCKSYIVDISIVSG